MTKEHHYRTEIKWTGNLGKGTTGYRDYSRNHVISVPGKPEIPGSSDSSFRGDTARYNPEEMLVVSLSSCHMLWYLHVCSEAGVIVTHYTDHATGVMEEQGPTGAFSLVTLHPVVTVLKKEMMEKATSLHDKAHSLCYIARSVKFDVRHSPVCRSEEE